MTTPEFITETVERTRNIADRLLGVRSRLIGDGYTQECGIELNAIADDLRRLITPTPDAPKLADPAKSKSLPYAKGDPEIRMLMRDSAKSQRVLVTPAPPAEPECNCPCHSMDAQECAGCCYLPGRPDEAWTWEQALRWAATRSWCTAGDYGGGADAERDVQWAIEEALGELSRIYVLAREHYESPRHVPAENPGCRFCAMEKVEDDAALAEQRQDWLAGTDLATLAGLDVDHRTALQLALITFQSALVEHCTDSLEAEKLAIRAHAAARKCVKPSMFEGRQPARFGGE